jgi:hypothetical protein
MAELGSLTVRLNAVTADFEKKMGDAGKALDGINAKMALGVAKEFGQALVKAVKDVAEVMPDLQAQLDELDKSWKKFLATAFGETFKSGVDLLEKFVKFSTDAANVWKDLSSYGIGKLMGMSDKELEAGLVATQNARTAKDNEIDFGGKATAPEVTLGIEGMLAPAKDKWADAFKGVFGTGEDAFDALAESGVGFRDVAEDVVLAGIDKIKRAVPEAFPESRIGPMHAMVGKVERDNLATTSQMIEGQSIAQGIGSKILGASGLAGTVTSNAIQAGMSGGGSAALASIGTDLLLSSAGFKGLMESLNPMMQSFADLLGLVLVPLKPLSSLFDVVADAVKSFVLGVYEILDAIPGISFKKEIKAIKEMGDSAEDAGETLSATFSDLNVPQGVKVALARYGAIDTSDQFGSLDNNPSLQGGGSVAIHIAGMTITANDVDGLKKQLTDIAERETYKQSGNTMAGFGLQMGAWVR